MDKEDVVHVHGLIYYSAIKKGNLPFETTWIYLEIYSIMLSEISHTDKDQYFMIVLIRGI